jgi:hypothetical protein
MMTQNCKYNFSSHCPTFVFRTCYLEGANLSCMQGGVSELRILGFGLSRTFYDRRLAQEVSGDNLGDVSSHNLHYPCSFISQLYFPFGAY